MSKVKIAVIGGGASGLMAAVMAANNGADVTIFEATKRVGNKILLTGNGKCNFTNLSVNDECYYSKDSSFVSNILERFSPYDTKSFFEGAGMFVKDKNGYLYPRGEQASIVLDVLRLKLKEYDVNIYTETKIIKIEKNNKIFNVWTENNKMFLFDKVIIATGGRSYPKTGSDGNGYKLAKKLGHTMIPTVPALVQLCGNDKFYSVIAGVRSEGKATLYVDNQLVRQEFGEIQFTDYGISGIPIFQLSRLAAYGLFENKKVKIFVDVLPEYDKETLKELVEKKRVLHKKNSLEDFMCGFSNKKLCLLAIKLANLKPDCNTNSLSVDELVQVVLNLKQICFNIKGTKGYDTAQVTAGGVNVSELDNNLGSKITDGLYFTGEVIDVDGICGGYNLQWAFATGYIAGCASAEK